MTGVIADAGFQCVIRRGIPEDTISYRNDNGTWLNRQRNVPAPANSAHFAGMDVEMMPCMALEDVRI